MFDIYLGADLGGVVPLAKIKPFVANVGHALWVITGDLPLTYVDTRVCPATEEALAVYCVSATIWLTKTLKGKPTREAIKLSRHEDFGPLESEADLRSAVGAVADALDRFLPNESRTAVLEPGLKEHLEHSRRAAHTWSRQPRAVSDPGIEQS